METIAASAISVDAHTLPFQWEFSCDSEVDYETEENANIIYSALALAVDKELQPDSQKADMSVTDGKLLVHFEAVEARFLRASYSAPSHKNNRRARLSNGVVTSVLSIPNYFSWFLNQLAVFLSDTTTNLWNFSFNRKFIFWYNSLCG